MAGPSRRSRRASSGPRSTISSRTSRGSRSRRSSASSGSSAWSSSRRTRGRSGRSRGARGDRALRRRAEPLPGRRRVSAAGRARRAARRRASRRSSLGAGSDGLVDCLSQAALEPGDEIVCGWPSFPSYVIDARKLGAVPVHGAAARRALRPRGDARGDHAADEDRLHLPTRTTRPGRRTRAPSSTPASTACPSTSLTVLDQAYFEYIDDPDYPDGVEEYLKQGRRVVVLRTFSKIYGLAGLRVGYGVAPGDVVTAIGEGAARVRHHDAGAGGGAREPRRRGRARAAARAERGGPRGARGDPARARARAGRAGGRRTSSSWRSAATRGRSSSRCCARA